MTPSYEYKVVPAPRRGEKAKGAKSTADRFGVALAHAMNGLAAEGWEYLRAETLPCDERVGLTGTATHFHHMLVFRRVLPGAKPAAATAFAAEGPALVPRGLAVSTSEAAALIPEAAPEATVIAALHPRPPEGVAPPLGPALTHPPSGKPNGRV